MAIPLRGKFIYKVKDVAKMSNPSYEKCLAEENLQGEGLCWVRGITPNCFEVFPYSYFLPVLGEFQRCF